MKRLTMLVVWGWMGACAQPGGGKSVSDATTSVTDTLATDTSAAETSATSVSDVSDDATSGDTTTQVSDTGDSTSNDTGDERAEWPPPSTIGGARAAEVLVPESYDGYAAVPVVMLLGGYDYFARDLDDWIELSSRVDALGFILVLPDGLVDEDGSPYWNATDTCCDYYESGVDDVAYLTGLMDELAARFHVTRTGLVGHSNGGFMAYRMACEIPQRLGGIVSIAGSGWVDEADCRVRDVPLSILQVHGSDDDIMPFDGDDEAPGAIEMLERWGERDDCTVRSWQLADAHNDYADEGSTEIGTYSSGCVSGADVRLWLLNGSDHYPTFTRRFTDDALAWLLERLTP